MPALIFQRSSFCLHRFASLWIARATRTRGHSDALPRLRSIRARSQHDHHEFACICLAATWTRNQRRNSNPTGDSLLVLPSGEGLAIAAALEDETYPIEDLVFDLANIRAGPRFAGEDSPLGGRLGILCQRVYGRADHPGIWRWVCRFITDPVHQKSFANW
jgi:hypothetical protein